MATFITAKAVGQSVYFQAQTTTEYWQAIHDGTTYGPFEHNGYQSITLTNSNGEFIIQSCDSEGNSTGDITSLNLNNNQLTSFDGTGLTSLVNLVNLRLQNNLLTSVDLTGLTNLTYLYLDDNPVTSLVNNQILSQLSSNGLEGGYFVSSNGRTSTSNTSYYELLNRGWSLGGLYSDMETPTFITSKAVGESVDIFARTTTGHFQVIHDGTTYGPFSGIGNGGTTITITNPNGEFTIQSINNNSYVSGSITRLDLGSFWYNNQITSFDGTGLSNLTQLWISNNQLTSFDGTGLTSLGVLDLSNNQLTSFDGTGLVILTYLNLNNNPITPISNNNTLSYLVTNGLEGGEFTSSNGRTSEGNTDYDTLISRGWNLLGLDLVDSTTTTTTLPSEETTTTTTLPSEETTTTTTLPSEETTTTTTSISPKGNGKIRVKGINTRM